MKKKLLVQVCLLVALWAIGYFLTVKTTVVSKLLTSFLTHEFKWIELTALQQLIALLLSAIPLVIVKPSLCSWYASHQKFAVCACAVCNALTNLSMNAAYEKFNESSTSSDTIEACLLLLTFTFISFSSKTRFVCFTSNFLSLMLIVFGVGTLGSKTKVSTAWRLIAALVVATALAIRNVLLKKLETTEKCSSHQQFMVMSLMSTLFVAPLWIVKVVITRELFSAGWLDTLSGVTYAMYNLSSFHVLQSLNTVTHSILTILIKVPALVEIASFKELHTLQIWSIFLIIVGICFYKWNAIRPKLVCSSVFIIAIAVWLFISPLLHLYYSNIQYLTGKGSNDPVQWTPACNRIFTVWVYEKPIPTFVAENIIALAHQNPNMSVHISCGNTQCVEALTQQRSHNMEIEFVNIKEIVQELPSLKLWWSRLLLNKVLAGAKFENHLQDVTTLATLWKYGGFYVDPTLTLESSLSTECLKDTSPWISKEMVLSAESDQPLLNVVFFPSHHPFIKELVKHYLSNYPISREDAGNIFRQDYMSRVWDIALNSNAIRSPLKTRVLIGVSASQINSLPPARHFGMLKHSSDCVSKCDMTVNEDIVGLQFLPFLDTLIDPRNTVQYPVTTFYSAGMSTALPRNVQLIPLSVHFEKNVTRKTELIRYLKAVNESIGCRDSDTLNYLTQRNIKAFLSGSLMLLVSISGSKDRPHRRRVYITDVSQEVFHLLPLQIQSTAVSTEQNIIIQLKSENSITRLSAMYRLLEEYESGELVVTRCVQCASACVALGTPVIFINTNSNSEQFSRSTRITSLFHVLDLSVKSTEQAREWLNKFAWHDIPPNPNVGEMMRLRASAWNVIRQNQALRDSGKKFGLIPMSPPYNSLPSDRRFLFHMLFTSSSNDELTTFGSSVKQSGQFNWRHMRSVESIFHHHPNSDLIIHSNTLSQSTFDALTEAGYSVRVKPYSLKELLARSPAEKFIDKIQEAKKGPYWVYSESDLLRLLVLYKWGGVYMDTDIILVQPLTSLPINGAGWEDKTNHILNNAFLFFEKGHQFLKELLAAFVQNFDGEIWGHNGPALVTRVWNHFIATNRTSNDNYSVNTYKYTMMYMFHYSEVKNQCFNDISGKTFDINKKILHTKAYGVHINAKITGYLGVSSDKLKKGTLCSELLNSYCILCDHTY